jgi:hypothetical protein
VRPWTEAIAAMAGEKPTEEREIKIDGGNALREGVVPSIDCYNVGKGSFPVLELLFMVGLKG